MHTRLSYCESLRVTGPRTLILPAKSSQGQFRGVSVFSIMHILHFLVHTLFVVAGLSLAGAMEPLRKKSRASLDSNSIIDFR